MLKLYNTGKNDSLKLQLNQQLQNMRDSIENYNRALKLATIQWIETMPHSYISATELYSLMINQQLGTIEANRLFHHLTDPVQQSRVGQLIAATLQKSMVNIQAQDFTEKYFDQENIKLKSGKFLNLVVQEIDNNIISLYDIDEIEYRIYKLLKTKKSINYILYKCMKYFNEQVVNEYYKLYEELIITNIKQLIIKKAIRPF
jgi:predicted methyltransferase